MDQFLKSILCSILFSLAFNQGVGADTADGSLKLPVDVSSSQGMASYLLYLRKYIPEIFESGGSWFVDPIKVIQNQNQFLSRLNQPEKLQIFRAEQAATLPVAPIRIDAHLVVPVQGHISQFTQTMFQRLLTEFARLDKVGPANENLNSQLSQQIVSLVQKSHGLTSMGLLTGLIQSLPGEKKAEAFRLPPEQKKAFVLAHLTDADVAKSFRSTVYSGDQLRLSFLAPELQRLETTEKQVAFLALYQEWNRLGRNSDSLQDLVSYKATSEDSGLRSIEHTLDEKESRRIKEFVQTQVQNLIKPELEKHEILNWEKMETFTIETLPADMAAFRGSLNGDCFTTYAFGYAYSPAERTFLIKDHQGKFLMTVYAIEVQVNGERALYIHDMGSSNTNEKYGSLVARAFDAAKVQLGVQHIVIGSKGMHHSRFKTSIVNESLNTELQPVQFLDPQSRELIGDLLVSMTNNPYSKGHDLPKSHPTVRIYTPKADLGNRVEVTVSALPDKNLGHENYSSEQIRNILLDLKNRGQDEIANLLFQGLVPGAGHSFDVDLKNREGLTVQEYLLRLQNQITAAGFPWDPSLFKTHGHFFAEGYLNAPDIWQGPESAVSKQTADFVTSLLSGTINNPVAIKALTQHPEIAATPQIDKLLRSTIKDNPMSLIKFISLTAHFHGVRISDATLAAVQSSFHFQNFKMISEGAFAFVAHSGRPLSAESQQFLNEYIKTASPTPQLIEVVRAYKELWTPSTTEKLLEWKNHGANVDTLIQTIRQQHPNHGLFCPATLGAA
jgi:hypothetical protein